MRHLVLPCAAALLSTVAGVRSVLADVTAEETNRGVTIKIGEELFAEYLIRSGTKPILWPINGPTGKPMTRAFPMLDDVAGEEKDHIHQRSCWFTHGNVNGIDFWSEPGSTANSKSRHGVIEHRKFIRVEGGATAVVAARNAWLDPDGKQQCEETRTMTFRHDADRRWIDFDFAITATPGAVTFGETKEGSFGVRVASTISVDKKQGGRIVNSHGETDKVAWGKRAEWVDYHGPVDGQRVGLAIFNHPSSLRAPHYWHVRPYGLFAANPFGERDFTGAGDGSYTLESGKTFKLSYRLLLHKGDEKSAKIAEAYSEYAKTPRP